METSSLFSVVRGRVSTAVLPAGSREPGVPASAVASADPPEPGTPRLGDCRQLFKPTLLPAQLRLVLQEK
jgi:hypothetical protein